MKKATLILDGKEIEVQLSEDELKKLIANKATGYQKVYDECYYYIDSIGSVEYSENSDTDDLNPDMLYQTANYYSDFEVAANNAHADEIMRQLRRFAVEHRNKDIDWTDRQCKYYIYYDYELNKIKISDIVDCRDFGQIYFNTEEAVELAVETFKDELTWYFKEYRDSL